MLYFCSGVFFLRSGKPFLLLSDPLFYLYSKPMLSINPQKGFFLGNFPPLSPSGHGSSSNSPSKKLFLPPNPSPPLPPILPDLIDVKSELAPAGHTHTLESKYWGEIYLGQKIGLSFSDFSLDIASFRHIRTSHLQQPQNPLQSQNPKSPNSQPPPFHDHNQPPQPLKL